MSEIGLLFLHESKGNLGSESCLYIPTIEDWMMTSLFAFMHLSFESDEWRIQGKRRERERESTSCAAVWRERKRKRIVFASLYGVMRTTLEYGSSSSMFDWSKTKDLVKKEKEHMLCEFFKWSSDFWRSYGHWCFCFSFSWLMGRFPYSFLLFFFVIFSTCVYSALRLIYLFLINLNSDSHFKKIFK